MAEDKPSTVSMDLIQDFQAVEKQGEKYSLFTESRQDQGPGGTQFGQCKSETCIFSSLLQDTVVGSDGPAGILLTVP